MTASSTICPIEGCDQTHAEISDEQVNMFARGLWAGRIGIELEQATPEQAEDIVAHIEGVIADPDSFVGASTGRLALKAARRRALGADASGAILELRWLGVRQQRRGIRPDQVPALTTLPGKKQQARLERLDASAPEEVTPPTGS